MSTNDDQRSDLLAPPTGCANPGWLAERVNELVETRGELWQERGETDRWTVQVAMALGVPCEGENPDVRAQYRELRKRILAQLEGSGRDSHISKYRARNEKTE
jgi:hypothetical protein